MAFPVVTDMISLLSYKVRNTCIWSVFIFQTSQGFLCQVPFFHIVQGLLWPTQGPGILNPWRSTVGLLPTESQWGLVNKKDQEELGGHKGEAKGLVVLCHSIWGLLLCPSVNPLTLSTLLQADTSLGPREPCVVDSVSCWGFCSFTRGRNIHLFLDFPSVGKLSAALFWFLHLDRLYLQSFTYSGPDFINKCLLCCSF